MTRVSAPSQIGRAYKVALKEDRSTHVNIGMSREAPSPLKKAQLPGSKSADGAVAYAVQFREDLSKDSEAIVVHLLKYMLCDVQGGLAASRGGAATGKQERSWSRSIHASVDGEPAKSYYEAIASIRISYQKRQPRLSHMPLPCSGRPGDHL